MRIALIGTRGVPASYGGFETAVEEVGKRLAAAGQDVTVYARGPRRRFDYLGMTVVQLPAVQLKAAETLAHTSLALAHALRQGYDAAVVFNAANAPLARSLQLRGIPYAVHVDGLEWKRLKWGPTGRRYYLWAERLAARTANALIADARAIQDYYTQRYRAETVYIPYGAPQEPVVAHDKLSELGLEPGRYHLIVARFEPENFVDVGVDGFVRSDASYPLVVVGSAPYAAEYTRKVQAAAGDDPRVRFVGGVWDQDLLDQLYANATSYIHGHSVGGTNPSLLRAMGHGALVLALDVVFNREVLGPGRFFREAADLARLIEWAEAAPKQAAEVAVECQERAQALFHWDRVAERYEWLCARLAQVGPSGTVRDDAPTTPVAPTLV